MTKDASFKKVVRRHAEDTGQRYTEALTNIEGLGARNGPRAGRRSASRPPAGPLRHRPRRGDQAQRAQDLRLPDRKKRRRAVGRPHIPPPGRVPVLRAMQRSCGS